MQHFCISFLCFITHFASLADTRAGANFDIATVQRMVVTAEELPHQRLARV